MKKINNFIKKRPYLIWYVKDYDSLSEGAIVEAVLNYGDWDDVQKMIKILGMKKTAAIFKKQARQKRCNYRPEIKNYFQLYFKKYHYA
jgi:hypothetical protein